MPDVPFRALIAGAGVAGLEAALALRDYAGDKVDVTVVAPNSEFVYRPTSVKEPFSYAKARRYPVAEIVSDAGATLVEDSFAWVDRDKRVMHTTDDQAFEYDALILAIGAKRYERFPHAITIDDRRLDEIFRGVVQDTEEGYTHSIAFVMPSEICWPLPLYELALMTAQRAYSMNVNVDITIVTPERAPLATFGAEASSVVEDLLAERGISVETHAQAQVPNGNRVVIAPGDRVIDVDRVVALPALVGPSIRGLPAGDEGFIPIDDHCRVLGVERIYAAGDATQFPIKHGGLSTQHADTAARDIARLAGVEIESPPLRPEILGLLLTGTDPLYLKATIVAGAGFRSKISKKPLWSPQTKIAAKYLGPYLAKLDGVVI